MTTVYEFNTATELLLKTIAELLASIYLTGTIPPWDMETFDAVCLTLDEIVPEGEASDD
ncbi:MAG: hypothetical protein JXA33_10865 [Anaerolineae bacterium]|nr:hypothetical protein [Anaerolineae bacterium]